MIVQIRLELDDNARRNIASHLAGKDVKRLANRHDITGVVTGIMDALKVRDTTHAPDPASGGTPDALVMRRNGLKLNEPDPEDAERLAGAEPGTVVGWNKVKYRLGASA